MTRRLLRAALVLSGIVLVVLLTATLVVARTGRGQRVALDLAMQRIQSALNGDLRVGDIDSRTLFAGVTLRDVVLLDKTGAPVLEADSVRANYSAVSFMLGGRSLARLQVWRPRVTLARLEGGEWNVASLLSSTPDTTAPTPGPDSTGTVEAMTSAGRLVARDVMIVDGTLSIEASDPSQPPQVYDGISAGLGEIVIGAAAEGVDRFEVSRLEALIHLGGEPIDVRDFVGTVIRDATTVTVEAERLRLGESEASGTARIDWGSPTGPESRFTIDASDLNLIDLRWLDPRLPDARGAGLLEATMGNGESTWTLSDARFESGGGELGGSGTVLWDGGLRLQSVDLDASDLDLAVIRPFIGESEWAWGIVDGRLRLDGTLADMAMGGRFTISDPDRELLESTLEIEGRAWLGASPGARDLRIVAAPLDYHLIRHFVPGVRLTGVGTADVVLNGAVDAEGLEVVARLSTAVEGGSRAEVSGRISRAEGRLALDAQIQAQPLLLAQLGELAPMLSLRGQATGAILLRGPIDRLSYEAVLTTSGGSLRANGVVNAEDPAGAYSLQAELDAVDLSRLSGRVPEPTLVTGRIVLDAAGGSLDALRGIATFDLDRSSIQEIQVQRAAARLTVGSGVLQVDSLSASSTVGRLTAQGTFALSDTVPAGVLDFRLDRGSLDALRPVLYGPVDPTAADPVALDLEVLGPIELGVPEGSGPALAGSVTVQGVVRGGLGRLTGGARAELADAVYRGLEVDSASISVPNFAWGSGLVDAQLEATGVGIYGRRFERASASVGLSGGRGDVDLELRRNDTDGLRGRAVVRSDSTGTFINLDQLQMRAEGDAWNLGGPARFAWTPRGFSIRDLRILRPGVGVFRLEADGELPARGSGQLRIEARQLDLGRMARLIEFEEGGLEGMVDMSLEVTGTLSAPEIVGDVDGRDIRYRVVSLERVEGDVEYADEVLTGDIGAWKDARRVFRLVGTYPANLAFTAVEDRVPEAPIDLALVADSVPLTNVLGFFDGFSRIDGELTGRFTIGGTPSDLEPSGTVELSNGAAFLDDFGIRPSDVQGTFVLTPDGRVEVDATVRESGTATVSGTIDLNPLQNPRFALTGNADRFRAVARRDALGRVSGRVGLSGSYRSPVVSGNLRVDDGVLFLDEFVRAAAVVDLSDPTVFEILDPEILELDEVVRESQNPFVQNLQINVDLSMERDTWLRSPVMNVEIAGQLQTTYDRARKNLAMFGDLRALRGTYLVVGRQFAVQEGIVQFVGTPGVNPNLNITATNRLRTTEGDVLDVTATVGGTLLRPEPTLSSDLQGASEDDLISYLLFGRPAYALASPSGIATGSFLGAAGLSLTLGALANQVSALVADELPLDYLSVSTQQSTPSTLNQASLSTGLASTEIEIGKYISDEVFLKMVLRPWAEPGQELLSAARMEWRFDDQWGLETFIEDRLARLGASGLDRLAFNLRRVIGFQLFREWGY